MEEQNQELVYTMMNMLRRQFLHIKLQNQQLMSNAAEQTIQTQL